MSVKAKMKRLLASRHGKDYASSVIQEPLPMESCTPPAALNVLLWPVVSQKNRVGGSAAFSFIFAFQYIGQTLDTPAENGGCGYDFASGVHKYLYAQDDPVNNEDPSGNDYGDFDIRLGSIFQGLAGALTPTEGFGNNTIGALEGAALPAGMGVFTPIGSGTWLVTKQTLTLSDQDQMNGASPNGFMVVFNPVGIPSGGKIVIYQTITPPANASDGYPHVDNTPPPHQSTAAMPLPPQITPLGKLPYSYIDSPTWGSAGSLLPGTYELTAVAVLRANGKDAILGHHYFKWSNRARTISDESDSYTKQWEDAMGHWDNMPGF
jgi:hypothetical protein